MFLWINLHLVIYAYGHLVNTPVELYTILTNGLDT